MKNKYRFKSAGPGSEGETTVALTTQEAQIVRDVILAFNKDPVNDNHAAPWLSLRRVDPEGDEA